MRQRIIFAILIAVISSSCQKKAQGQTVAIVNNEEITSGELNAELSNNANFAGQDPKAAQNAALQELISRKLVVQQARSDGLDKSPEYINQLRRSTDDLLINMLVSRQLKTSQVPSAQEISAFEASRPELFAGREVWTLNQIIYPQTKNAAVNAKLSAAKSLDEVAQILAASGIQFTRDTKKIDTALFPHAIYTQISGMPAGEPFIAPGPDKAVANVISAREPSPTNPDQARTLALNAMRRDQINKIIQDKVKNLRASAKIEYQPGFGPPAKK
jgi:EpsD family peptidyl-prolyl cis-trans isomerase